MLLKRLGSCSRRSIHLWNQFKQVSSGSWKHPDFDYTIEVMKEEQFEESMMIIVDQFCYTPTEPLCSTGMIREEGYYENTIDVRNASLKPMLDHNLSLVAIENGEIVSSLFSDVIYCEGIDSLPPEPNEEFRSALEKSPYWTGRYNLRKSLENLYFERMKHIGFTTSVHMAVGAVNPESRGNSIIQNLIGMTGRLAISRGLDSMHGETTNYFTERVLEKSFDANYLSQIAYEPYVYHGEQIFAGCEERAKAYLDEELGLGVAEKFKDIEFAKGITLYEVILDEDMFLSI